MYKLKTNFNYIKKLILILLICANSVVNAQLNNVEQLITTSMKLWPNSFSAKSGGKARWSYDQGIILKGVEDAWKLTGNGAYFNYIQQSMDFYVKEDGCIYN